MTDVNKEGYDIDPETAASIRKLAEHNDEVRADERERIAKFAEEQAAKQDREAADCVADDCHAWARDARSAAGALRAFAAKLRGAP